MNQVIQKFENKRTPPPPPHLTNFRLSKLFLVCERLDCKFVSAGSRQIIPSSRMFIQSDLYLADTNQPVAYSGSGETKDVDRIANCNWWPRQEKQLVLMFVHRWRGGTQWLTSQGGFVEPLEPPLDPQLTFEDNFLKDYEFKKYLKEGCMLSSDQHFSFKYFLKDAFV